MTTESTTFGRLLRHYRQAAALSQEALAERAALSLNAVGQLETGRRTRPRLETVHLLAQALGLSAAERAILIAAARPVDDAVGASVLVPALQIAPAHSLPHNLPAPTTALIGREYEVTRAVALLQRDPQAGTGVACGSRLLTLTGAGGVGKTRLAIEIARALLESEACADGAWLVEMAPLADPALVVPTVAATLGLRETPGTPLLTSLTEYLAARRLLLVLDNCEHLVEACAALAAALLRACPHLRLLATSREGLAIPEETLRRVPSLAFPDPRHLPLVEELPAYAAVELFLQRARARREEVVLTAHNAPAVAQICAQLDGIPLALELAASRLSALPVEQVAARLDDCFRLLTGGSRTAVPRQRTLRATLDWSYNLLSPREQVLLRRLSVFAGGWTLEAAEAVCADDVQPPFTSSDPAVAVTPDRAIPPRSEESSLHVEAPINQVRQDEVLDLLAGLVDKSLVVLETARPGDGVLPQREARYRLLETVRQYGQERLVAAGETGQVRDRHLAWSLALAEEGDAGIKGPQEVAWLHRLELEHDNLRAALAWGTLASTATPADPSPGARPATGLRLVGALWWFWSARQHLREGVRWLEAALAGGGADTGARARAQIGAGFLTAQRGDVKRAQTLFAESLALSRAAGDRGGCAQALYRLALMEGWLGNDVRAQELWEESLSLFREQQDAWNSVWALRKLGGIARCQRDWGRATALLEESLRLARSVGQPSGIAWSLAELGDLAVDRGDVRRGGPLLAESLTLARAVGDTLALGEVLQSAGLLARQQGDVALAQAHFKELLALGRTTGNAGHLVRAHFYLACLAIEGGDAVQALTLATRGLALSRRWDRGEHREKIADNLKVVAMATVAAGQPTRAAKLFGAYAAIAEALTPFPDRWPPAPQLYAEALATSRSALGEDAFAAAWEQGKALTLEEAIALAMAQPGPGADTQ